MTPATRPRPATPSTSRVWVFGLDGNKVPFLSAVGRLFVRGDAGRGRGIGRGEAEVHEQELQVNEGGGDIG